MWPRRALSVLAAAADYAVACLGAADGAAVSLLGGADGPDLSHSPADQPVGRGACVELSRVGAQCGELFSCCVSHGSSGVNAYVRSFGSCLFCLFAMSGKC